MDAAVLDRHTLPEHADAVPAPAANLAVSQGHIDRGDLHQIPAGAGAINNQILVDTRSHDLEPAHDFRPRRRADVPLDTDRRLRACDGGSQQRYEEPAGADHSHGEDKFGDSSAARPGRGVWIVATGEATF